MKAQQHNRKSVQGSNTGGKSNKNKDDEIQNRKHRKAVRELKESSDDYDWSDPKSWEQAYLDSPLEEE